MNAERALEHLERIKIRNAAWLVYIMWKSAVVDEWIVRLRIFAARRPGKIARIVGKRADELQNRLNRVLSR